MPITKHDQLNAAKVKSLVTGNIDGLYLDGEGLYLQIKGDNHSWLWRYTSLDGRKRDMGIGPLRHVTLAQARGRADDARRLLRDGVDPIDARKTVRHTARAERTQPRTKTFRDCWREWQPENLSAKTNHAKKYISDHISAMERYALPCIGATAIDKITEAEVVEVLQPIWSDTHDTATRVRSVIERVLSYAKQMKYRTGDNPAALSNINFILPKGHNREVHHHDRVEPDEMPAFMTHLREVEGVGARAAEMTILSALRTNAALPARWDEIDETRERWIVPKERMKTRISAFHVPLSDRMLVILDELRSLRRNEFIFPGVHSGCANESTLRLATYPLIEKEITVHGFRSSFRDWAGNDEREFEDAIIELCLAHKVKGAVKIAYMRDDYIERRAVVMQAWADFCAGKC